MFRLIHGALDAVRSMKLKHMCYSDSLLLRTASHYQVYKSTRNWIQSFLVASSLKGYALFMMIR